MPAQRAHLHLVWVQTGIRPNRRDSLSDCTVHRGSLAACPRAPHFSLVIRVKVRGVFSPHCATCTVPDTYPTGWAPCRLHAEPNTVFIHDAAWVFCAPLQLGGTHPVRFPPRGKTLQDGLPLCGSSLLENHTSSSSAQQARCTSNARFTLPSERIRMISSTGHVSEHPG